MPSRKIDLKMKETMSSLVAETYIKNKGLLADDRFIRFTPAFTGVSFQLTKKSCFLIFCVNISI